MKKRLLLLIVIGTMLGSCGLQDDPLTRVSGSVTDSITGLALESANVWLNDSAYGDVNVTDSAGYYQLATVGGRPKTVTSSKQGYTSKTRPVPGAGLSVRVDFLLKPDSLN